MFHKRSSIPDMENANWFLVIKDKEIDVLLDQTSGWSLTPFQSAHWLKQCARHDRAKGHRSIIVAGTDEAGLFAVLPLTIKQKFGLRQLCWSGQDLNDYNLPLLHPTFGGVLDRTKAVKMWSLAAKLIGGIDLVNAAKQPVMLLDEVNEFASIGGFSETDRAHFVTLSGNWSDTEAQLYGRRTRGRLNGKQNKLKRLGDLNYLCVSEPASIDQAVNKLIEWKSAQLVATGASNPFLDPDYSTFFRSVARTNGAKGNVAIFALMLDEEPIALSYILTSRHRWIMYQSAYCTGPTASLSPGQLLNRYVLEQACAQGVRIYDYGYGDEEYKMKFCQQSVVLNRSLIAFTSRGFLARFSAHKLLLSRGFLKKNRTLRDLLLKSNKLLRSRKERSRMFDRFK
ncbi:MAG: GNAT family N-acetyltransferase [bacterium]|nr:GNAT family N-acetyltransferase [bacterium]